MNDKIIRAIKNKNTQEIIKLLDSGIDINEKDSKGNSLLSMACMPSSLYSPPSVAVVKLLLDRGADINSVDNNGNTSLMKSCTLHQKEIAKYLIDRGADVNIKNAEGKTALHIFAQNNALDVVSVILKNNIDVDQRDSFGNTALHYAIRYYMDMSKLLIDAGADLSIKNNNDETPIELAYKLWKQARKSEINEKNMIEELIDDALVYKQYDKMFKYLADYCKIVNSDIVNSQEYNSKLQEKLHDLENFKKYLLTLKGSIKKIYKNIENENDVDTQLDDIKKTLFKVNWYIGSVDEFYNKRVLENVVFPIEKMKDLGK